MHQLIFTAIVLAVLVLAGICQYSRRQDSRRPSDDHPFFRRYVFQQFLTFFVYLVLAVFFRSAVEFWAQFWAMAIVYARLRSVRFDIFRVVCFV